MASMAAQHEVSVNPGPAEGLGGIPAPDATSLTLLVVGRVPEDAPYKDVPILSPEFKEGLTKEQIVNLPASVRGVNGLINPGDRGVEYPGPVLRPAFQKFTGGVAAAWRAVTESHGSGRTPHSH